MAARSIRGVRRFVVRGTLRSAWREVQRDESDAYELGIPFPVVIKKTEFAIGIGGGTTIPLGSRWSYRADFRWYNPKAEWPESWRVYNGLTLHLAPR